MTGNNAFWDDLARDLEDPEFLREFVIESMRMSNSQDLWMGVSRDLLLAS